MPIDFARVLARSIEIAEEPDAEPVVVAVFQETLAEPAMRYLATERAVADAMTAFAKENHEALQALKG